MRRWLSSSVAVLMRAAGAAGGSAAADGAMFAGSAGPSRTAATGLARAVFDMLRVSPARGAAGAPRAARSSESSELAVSESPRLVICVRTPRASLRWCAADGGVAIKRRVRPRGEGRSAVRTARPKSWARPARRGASDASLRRERTEPPGAFRESSPFLIFRVTLKSNTRGHGSDVVSFFKASVRALARQAGLCRDASHSRLCVLELLALLLFLGGPIHISSAAGDTYSLRDACRFRVCFFAVIRQKSTPSPLVLVVGCSASGKTSLIQQLVYGSHPATHTPSLVDGYECDFVLDVSAASVTFVEVGGSFLTKGLGLHEEVKFYADEAVAVAYVVDAAAPASLDAARAARRLLNSFRADMDTLPRAVVVNKIDVEGAAGADDAAIQALVTEFDCPHVRTMATDRERVEVAFRGLVQRLFPDSIGAASAPPASAPTSSAAASPAAAAAPTGAGAAAAVPVAAGARK